MTDSLKTTCTHCGGIVEVESDSRHVSCAYCGTVYNAQELHEAVNPTLMNGPFPDRASAKEALEIIETRIAEIEETLEETRAEIDALRARELSGPLQLGCTFFGVFS